MLAFVRGLSQFIAVLRLARVEWEWIGCLEAAAAFGLSGMLARQPRRDASHQPVNPGLIALLPPLGMGWPSSSTTREADGSG